LTPQAEKAENFRALHRTGRVLILPNAWDVASARAFENAGFPAVATSSAGMMVSLGYPDGQTIDRSEFVDAIRRIGRVLTVPLSVDVVAGFGETPDQVAATVRDVVKVGAVGVNIEDFIHTEKRLYHVEKQIEKLKAVKKLQQALNVPIVINARTDAFRYAAGDETTRLKEAIRRAVTYRDAGADCVYPMGLADPAPISAFVKALNFPTNVMVRKGLPPVKELQRLGVARVSFGPAASYATMGLLKRVSKEVLDRGTYDSLLDGAISYDELNGLAVPKV
jgi:2-methylisocitrate lyase-like PEP mutase family enzyme